MNEQAYHPYNDYDLVRRKPAGVLIYVRPEQMSRNHKFNLDLTVDGKRAIVRHCFHSLMNSRMLDGRQVKCSFTREKLDEKGYHKFIPLPMYESPLSSRGGGVFTISVFLYPEGYEGYSSCFQERTFNVEIVDTGRLRLGFTRIDNAYGRQTCYESYNSRTDWYDSNIGYDPVSYRTVQDFVNSEEVRFYIESMFPIRDVTSKAINYYLPSRRKMSRLYLSLEIK